MLNKFVIVHKVGIGAILMYLFSIIFAPLGALVAIYRAFSKNSLRKVPRFLITDKISLGSSLFWGFLIFTIGFCLFLPLKEEGISFSSFEEYLPRSMVLSWVIAGFFMLIEYGKYKQYTSLADSLLEILKLEKNRINKHTFQINHKGEKYSFEKLWPILQDFQDCGILTLSPSEDYVNFFFNMNNLKRPIALEQVISWDCKACGAFNEVVYDGTTAPFCEYCETPYDKNKQKMNA